MTETVCTPHRNLSIDQQLALRTTATHLSREFDGVFGHKTIERFLHTSYRRSHFRRPAGLSDCGQVRQYGLGGGIQR
ncbi:hypothetical protein ACFZB5_31535 [Streptomyces nodosus]|uniref:hypothetical protein n=1 Tax=Streptomyces nodosus TaxID=40318 RepID=UPI0036EF6234